MGIELDKRNRTEVPVNGAKDGQENGMIAADADRCARRREARRPVAR